VRPVILIAAALSLVGASGCDDDGAIDSVTDMSLDPGVWKGDSLKVSGALPQAVGTFKPNEAVNTYASSYRTGPVFGAGCTYADGPRQLVVRVEGGNIRERAATLAKGHANPGESFVTRKVTVHGHPATLHWNGVGKTGDVVFVLKRRLVVQLQLVPASSDDEVVRLADAMDVAPLEALVLDGIKN